MSEESQTQRVSLRLWATQWWRNNTIKQWEKEYGEACIDAAKRGDRDAVVTFLAKIDPNANSHYPSLGIALFRALEGDHPGIAEVLLACPDIIDVNFAPADERRSSFWFATISGYKAVSGYTAVVALLLQHPGLKDNISEGLGRAVVWGYFDTVKLLLEHPDSDVNAQDKFGVPVLLLAASRGRLDIVNLLLKHPGIDINLEDPDGDCALTYAAKRGHKDVVRLLVNCGANGLEQAAAEAQRKGYYKIVAYFDEQQSWCLKQTIVALLALPLPGMK